MKESALSGMDRPKKRTVRWWLLGLNVLMVLAAIGVVAVYSQHTRQRREAMETENFRSTVESMKQVSRSYFELEYGYVQDWAAYIGSQNMTEDQALDYLRSANSQLNRYAHIVDMDTFEARSTNIRSGEDSVSCYLHYKDSQDTTEQIFAFTMEQMFSGQGISGSGEIAILGKYMATDIQVNVISLGSPVRLRTGDGGQKNYLLLRLIPVEAVRRAWIFPTEYAGAEVGLITKNGAYVIQSNSMRGQNFLEFIRAYNFQSDYNKADKLEQEMLGSAQASWQFQDSRGRECYWYFSQFGPDSGLAVLGFIPMEQLHREQNDAPVILVLIGVFAFLMAFDGWYLFSINRKLLESVEEARKASQAKTNFLSSMSHDIRTPMNGVLGMTDLARKHLDDPEYAARCLDKVSLAGQHLMTLINDVLDISKVESGKTVLNPAPFRMKELVDTLVSIIQPQAEAKGLDFQLKMEELPCPCLIGDQLRLNQVLLNLLTNAVKYTNSGGWVRFRVSQTALSDGWAELRFSVQDNGIGMTSTFQKTMYESFSREIDSRINKIQGSGLGLAIARQMVELMDGTIDCSSAPGRGTLFTVTIPLQATEESAVFLSQAQEEGSEDSSFAGVRILVAEDNELNWEIISTILKELGVEAVRAVNGRICVDMVQKAPPGTYDMIFMDIQMPEMNGREAARIIRGSLDPRIRDIPIAAMTADAFAEDIRACMDAGMNEHIAKPINIDQVLRVLRKFLAQSKTEKERES